MDNNNGILLITLNPGGTEIQPDQSVESCEEGCTYLWESWKGKEPGNSRLQAQIQTLFKEIACRIGVEDYKAVLESSVCGHCIPFRSPSFKSLKDVRRTINFSNHLWTKLLSRLAFQVIFCIDRITYKNIVAILLNLSYCKTEEQEHPINWGDYKALVTRFERADKKITLVWFPHLSTFSIFGREKSRTAIDTIMNEALRYFRPTGM